jgi:hypothetical protein
MGQGAPEAGPIPGAPERPNTVQVSIESLEYAPTTGIKGRTTACMKAVQILNICYRAS